MPMLYTLRSHVPSNNQVTRQVSLMHRSGVYKDMVWFILTFILGLTAVASDPCTPAQNCGIEETQIPDFNLVDVNPNSSTFGTQVSRSDMMGNLMIIYFSSAT